ncbi:protein CHROMATIN REMODELING 20 isoform X3 [Durio zibethinus]|uniref:ATP-dependent helicase ATRX n=1 Tax=Durio zibethinus TaxID=66656 RepID=A0A6P5YQM1_DURZI|nr:protein CHROMATIN REMODELING 20 isoform X3 [Durio zibethinus]
MEEKHEGVEDVESASSDSFIIDSDDDEPSLLGQDDGLHFEQSLTEKEIEDLISEFLEVESKAAEAQETLEKESLARVESEVREELAQTLQGDDLETAVADEMATFTEQWEGVLDEFESESAQLLEQLDGAGIDLPSLCKWIESQVLNGCSTEAWKRRSHWVGSQVTSEISESLADAEKHLQTQRPVRRKHGRLLEEGASGFLQKKLSSDASQEAVTQSSDMDWSSFMKICSDGLTEDGACFGSKNWASVYLASTPQQAALMGLKFPGVDEVEEIEDIDGSSANPLVADAIENERDMILSEEQRKNFRKVQEEDDANIDRKFHLRLKQRRCQRRSKQDTDCSECYCGWCGQSNDLVSCKSCKTLFCTKCIRRNIGEEFMLDVLASGWQCCCCLPSLLQKLTSELVRAMGSQDTIVSSSDSESENSDTNINTAISSKRKRKKKIRRILDDAELGEETKRKIAIEKERQECLKSMQFSAKYNMMNSSSCTTNLLNEASVEVLGDAITGYIVNVRREDGEEAVRIPPSISAKLKVHQIAGIRFMWENIIQSITKVRSGDKGLGCILAHMMGLGKTFQVIAFLYTAMRSVDLGLKTALIVTPVNVLHNWRQEFMKWRPSEVKPLRVFMLEDVPRERRAKLLTKWRTKGGVFLIGYAAFRNLSLGKHVKDRHMARDICDALQDGPDILVCDEAHTIKNTRADTTQALKQVKCQRRIALTGSPLQNNLMEYYCMVDFVREGFLGSSHEFRNRFQNPIENGQHTNSTHEDVKIMNQRSHILYVQLKGFVQRMDMSVVKKDLPPKTVFVIAVKLSPLQRKLYKRFLDVHGFTNDRASNEKIRKSFFAGYQALAQIWNHPGILQLNKEDRGYISREDTAENFLADDSFSDENMDYNVAVGEKTRNMNDSLQEKNDYGFIQKGWWRDLLHENNYKELDYSGKMVLLLDIITMCSDVGDKALVFSQSIPTLDLIELYLSRLPRRGKKGKFWKKGKDWYRLDGRTESSERQRLVERFNEPMNKRVKCTLISTRAGSLGINLYAANRVIIVDGSWNPTYDLQAIYRAWRYGQTKPVFAYRLMAHGTMEEKIYKRQVTKEGLAARVVDRQQVHRTISKEEMLHLFEFGDEENFDSLMELSEENGNQNVTCEIGKSLKQKMPPSHGSCSSDKLMESLLGKHHPRWIANYHEHETLLQENEDEKLSKEEQDMAWEVYRKTLEWEQVQRVSLDESAVERKPVVPDVAPPKPEPEMVNLTLPKGIFRSRIVQRKCTNLAHLLTLRSQGTKFGCSTVCGECAQEISWENLKRDSKMAR